MNIEYKLKLYPITEDSEMIYEGGMLDVVRIDFVEKWVECKTEYSNGLMMLGDAMFGRHRLDRWHYGDNRDERDSKSELFICINGVLALVE